MKTVIVVPTIRQKCIVDFLDVWKEEFASAEVIVVEDNPSRSFNLGPRSNVTHYCWEDIDAELGDRSWIIPRRTDCVRSYGYYKAAERQPDMIVTLDDDCYPTSDGARGFLAKHWARLQAGGIQHAWQATGIGPITRGYPYYAVERRWPCALNHGMWNRVPDYDAPTQLLQRRDAESFSFENQTIPVGHYFPMCGMNVAFLPEVAPAFYFLLMGRDFLYDRFGDIWAGVFIKKVCDHLGYAINSGDPAVDHQRASNVWSNLRKEAPGLELNETLWRVVDRVVLTASTFAGCYRQIGAELGRQADSSAYLKQLADAMAIWTDLFEQPAYVPSRSAREADESVRTLPC
jgi:hypothetical protein